MKNKSLCRHLSLIVLPIKTYNSMIYSNFSAKTLKTILTRLQIVCICFIKLDENKPCTIWNIILNKVRDLARREFHMSSRRLLPLFFLEGGGARYFNTRDFFLVGGGAGYFNTNVNTIGSRCLFPPRRIFTTGLTIMVSHFYNSY